MSTKPNPAVPGGALQAIAKRVYSHGSDDPPNPLFINAVEFTSMGMDVFMDTGVVRPESVAEAMGKQPPDDPAVVNFNVHFRFGMSIQTALQMHQKLSDMIQRTSQMMAM